jgi:hypothetical protein
VDRQVARAAILSAGFVALVVATAAAGEAPPGAKRAVVTPIRAERWLGPKADRVEALSARSTECLPPIVDADRAYLVEIGRAAFRTPELLGGQAARAGISCDACHQSGRTNPGFFFPGLSGAPGTADVTSSLFSSHREDGVDNPKPIPDLSGPKVRLNISQDPHRPDLETFLHGLITQEFDGPEPPPTVLKGVAAYVRGLSPAACPATARRQVRASDFLSNAVRAARAANAAIDRRDPATAGLMVEAARTQLGLVYERFDQPGAAAVRAQLRAADGDLAAAQSAIHAHELHAADRLLAWLAHEPSLAKAVEHEAPGSLFNPTRLRAAFATPARSDHPGG